MYIYIYTYIYIYIYIYKYIKSRVEVQGTEMTPLGFLLQLSGYYESCQDDSLGMGAWVAQSVKHPTSAQVMILRFVSLSPV